MGTKRIGFELTVYDTLDEMSEEDRGLLHQANLAREKAYAPYSKFHVGAAVLLENGTVVLGNNQENASYPSGLCAERVAIFHAGANHPGVAIKSIAISAVSTTSNETTAPAAPCGNCRQAIAEYEHKQKGPIAILMQGASTTVYKCHAIADLLPLAFDNSFLGDS
ncbi:MAG: cytidine deaminase [Flavobacteriaceae bacterium]|nr:cytidine deaminase [Flavobacteriaceae bacterium]